MRAQEIKVNFTNTLTKSANVLAWQPVFVIKGTSHFHQQNFTQLYKCTHIIMAMANIYVVSLHVIRQKEQCKFTGAKVAHKMLVSIVLDYESVTSLNITTFILSQFP